MGQHDTYRGWGRTQARTEVSQTLPAMAAGLCSTCGMDGQTGRPAITNWIVWVVIMSGIVCSCIPGIYWDAVKLVVTAASLRLLASGWPWQPNVFININYTQLLGVNHSSQVLLQSDMHQRKEEETVNLSLAYSGQEGKLLDRVQVLKVYLWANTDIQNNNEVLLTNLLLINLSQRAVAQQLSQLLYFYFISML